MIEDNITMISRSSRSKRWIRKIEELESAKNEMWSILQNSPSWTGSVNQYVRGNGSYANFPTIYTFTGSSAEYTKGDGSYAVVKRREVYSGTTNGSGVYTHTFSQSFSVSPTIFVTILTGNEKDISLCTVTATEFTITIKRRTDVIGLLPSYSPVSSANINVLIAEL